MVTDIGLIQPDVAISQHNFLPELHKVNQFLEVEGIVVAIHKNQMIAKGGLEQGLQLCKGQGGGLLID
jgi:hypothetical protein